MKIMFRSREVHYEDLTAKSGGIAAGSQWIVSAGKCAVWYFFERIFMEKPSGLSDDRLVYRGSAAGSRTQLLARREMGKRTQQDECPAAWYRRFGPFLSAGTGTRHYICRLFMAVGVGAGDCNGLVLVGL